MSKKAITIMMIGMFALGMFAGVALACTAFIGSAEAEEMTYRCWILCQPGSEVMIREKPGKRAEIVGAATCGKMLRTDWREKDGWIHVVELANETGEGWIYEGYVVFEEPAEVNAEMRIQSRGRVACRKWIGGKRSRWMRDGESVTVYWMNGEVAVTNRGFIMAEYLMAEYLGRP